jgi:hypothetical protein
VNFTQALAGADFALEGSFCETFPVSRAASKRAKISVMSSFSPAFTSRISFRRLLLVSAGLVLLLASVSSSIAQSETHGRKWKPLPATSHIVVTVKKGFNDKVMMNAAVIFHAVRDGQNDGNLEVKTDPEGKATIDVIEVGSHVTMQVIANGFATHAEEFDVDGPSKEVEVKMLRPQEQLSNYQDNGGKQSTVKPGVQEPPKPIKPPPTPSSLPSSGPPQ